MKKISLSLVLLLFMNILGLGVVSPVWAADPPAAPSNLQGAAGLNSNGKPLVTLTWRDNSGNETGFIIERSDKSGAEGGVFENISTVGPDVKGFTDTDLLLAPETTYYYRVMAYNDEGNSSYSNEAAVTTSPFPPSAPTGLTAAAATDSQINLSWTDTANNEDGFYIERKTSKSDFQLIVTVGADLTDYSDTGLASGVTYSYRVRAYNGGGHSDYSKVASATTGGKPAAPENLKAVTVSGTQINLTWTDTSSNEAGFKIERKNGSKNFSEIATVGPNCTAYPDTKLSTGVYTYRIKAFNDAGDSEYSAEASAETGTVPAAPSNLNAAVISDSRIDLKWNDNSDNENGFKIERKSAGGAFIEIGQVGKNVTAYPDAAPFSTGITYIYRVRAFNNIGDSPYGAEASAVTGVKPTAPTGLEAALVSSSQVKLTWTDRSNNETGFKIERRVGSSGDYSQIATVSANTTVYTNTGLSAGKTYYYRVRAYNLVGDSAYSSQVSITTAVPAAPSYLSAETISYSQINLSWDDNANNETGFKIERKKEGGSYTQIDTVDANITTYRDYDLASNTTYFYRIRAYNAAGNSAYCTEVSAATTFLGAPSRLKAETVSSSQIELSWTDNATNETGFKIERKTGSGSYKQIATVGKNVTAYTDTGLSNNTTYYYRVRSYNASANSAYSNEVSATTGSVPAAPTNLAATSVSSSRISLTWKDNASNETGFKIERKTSGGSYVQITTVSANTTAYTDTGLSANATYLYRVRAYNAIGNSAYSNEVTIGAGAPAAPTKLTATPASRDRIMLAWSDNASNESGFRVERKTSGGTFTQIASVGANTTVYSDTGLSTGVTYYYRVRAYNSTGNSAYSNEVSATTTAEAEKIIVLNIGKKAYYVNNKRLEMDVAPMISGNRTLLPIRYIAEAIGATVKWESAPQKVTLILKGKTVELWIGQSTARVDGVQKLIDPDNYNVKPIIIPPGRTMLPLRFVSESLGCRVDWNQTTQEVKVTYPAP